MVCGTHRCQQFCKERSAAFFSFTYLGEWPNVECVTAWFFFPTVLFGILPKCVYMVALSTRFETNTLLKLGFQAPNASEPTEAKKHNRSVAWVSNSTRSEQESTNAPGWEIGTTLASTNFEPPCLATMITLVFSSPADPMKQQSKCPTFGGQVFLLCPARNGSTMVCKGDA